MADITKDGIVYQREQAMFASQAAFLAVAYADTGLNSTNSYVEATISIKGTALWNLRASIDLPYRAPFIQRNGSAATGALLDPLSGLPIGSVQRISVPNPTGVAATDIANVNAAVAAAVASGAGAQVQFAQGAYNLAGGAPIVLTPGIRLVGAGAGGPFGGSTNANAGTTLTGDGTFACMVYNQTDLATQYSGLTAFCNQLVSGVQVSGFIFNNFTYAVKAGALANPGLVYGQVHDCIANNCTAWGFWFENFMECDFYRLYTNNCIQGQIYFGASGTSQTLSCGNTRIDKIFCQTPATGSNASQLQSRGVVFQARGGNVSPGATTAYMNDLVVDDVQTNRQSGVTVTQACTMANGSTTFAVTDGTQFAVGMPVQFTSSANGFTVGQTYFVYSVAGNNLRVSNFMGGDSNYSVTQANIAAAAPQASTGTAAISITTYGFPSIEIVAFDGNIQPCCYRGLDMEGTATTEVLLQNAFVQSIECNLVGGPNLIEFVSRGCGEIDLRCPGLHSTDLDNNVGTGNHAFFDHSGVKRSNLPSGGLNALPYGIWSSGAATTEGNSQQYAGVMNIHPKNQPTMVVNNGTGQLQINNNVHYAQQTLNGGGNLFAFANQNIACWSNGGTAGTLLLPAISNTSGSSNLGLKFLISNSDSVTCTVTANGAQTIKGGGASATTFALLANTACEIIACQNSSGALYWAVK